MRILLVEDEPEMARLIASLAASAGIMTDRAPSLLEALEAGRQRAYDMVIVDRRLPDGEGLSLVPVFRELCPGIRIMVLSALDALGDKVSGLDAGADDYMTKPFQGEELVARIRACLRRPGGVALPPLVVGALSLDLHTREVIVAGKPVAFHRRELMLLQALMRRASRVATRETLVDEVYSLEDDVQANTLDSVVSRLRRRLQESGARASIHTVRGIGYILAEDDA